MQDVEAVDAVHNDGLLLHFEALGDPPGFRVFREASVNLLIHQDYGDHSRKAVIKFFRDGIQLWNPGDVFGDDSRLWEPGEKEVRNPSIAMAMRRIAMCEQAGTGLRMMREAWSKLGHPAPSYKNDRAGKAFELFIPELDKEVDMASDLVKAMFGGAPQVEAQDEAQEAQVEAQVELPKWQMDILSACSHGEKTGKELLAVAGYQERILPANEAVLNSIRRYLKTRKNVGIKDPLFLSTHNKRIDSASVWRIVKKYLKLAQIEKDKLSPHTLRHTFATVLLKQGENILIIKELLSHKNLRTTERYLHINNQDLRSAVSKIDLRF